jgi:hypothetical protein
MARNKARDDKFFNCEQDYEIDQVASHYGPNKQAVVIFLKRSCVTKVISNSTHMQIYQLIKNTFDYPIPV